ALARALVNSPRVLLLDEPLGALDMKLRKEMQLFIKGLQHDVGITFIHVTHDQEEAMTMADRIAVMNQGRIEQLGTPDELYERPQTAFVAGFLGISNLLRGTVAGPDEVKLGDGTTIRVRAGSLAGRTGEVAVGIRPEKIRPDEQEEAHFPVARGVPEEVRGPRRLRRGHQRQRLVLREDPGGTVARPVGLARHHRPD